MPKLKDQFVNYLSSTLTLNGTTNVHTEVNLGVSLGRGQGIVIDNIQVAASQTVWASMKADAEHWSAYFSTSNDVTNTSLTGLLLNSKVACAVGQNTALNGAAANLNFYESDIIRYYTPPIIVASPRIYLGGVCSSGVSGDLYARLGFRYVELTPSEYLEIAETFVLVG